MDAGGNELSKIKKCRQCGVPLGVSRDLIWHGSGIITQAKGLNHRMVFMESDNLDELFTSIEKMAGRPVEPVVIESKRSMTRKYMTEEIPPLKRMILHSYGPKILSRHIARIGRHYGYGDIRLEEIRSRNDALDYQSVSIRHPYSLPLFCGDSVGAKEAMDGRDFSVSWEEVGDHEYMVTFRVGEHPQRTWEHPRKERLEPKPGELEFERCASCGIPLGVARCRWNLESGTIHDPGTGRRMAIFSPGSVEGVLDDIEKELGGDMREQIIDIQRRYVRNTLGREDVMLNRPSYRKMAGLRGLGFIRKLELGDTHCTVLIENSCLPLLLVGIIQAHFEMGTEHESAGRRWELRPDGDLLVELEA